MPVQLWVMPDYSVFVLTDEKLEFRVKRPRTSPGLDYMRSIHGIEPEINFVFDLYRTEKDHIGCTLVFYGQHRVSECLRNRGAKSTATSTTWTVSVIPFGQNWA